MLSKKNKRQSIATPRTKVSNNLESLESRQLLSAALPYVSHGVLNVFGTRHSDSVSVQRNTRHAWQLDVNVNGSHYSFSNRSLGGVNVQTAAGKDRIGAGGLGMNVDVNGHHLPAGSNTNIGSTGNAGNTGSTGSTGNTGTSGTSGSTNTNSGGSSNGNTNGSSNGNTNGNSSGNTSGTTINNGLNVNFFPVGIYSQPTSSFSYWKSIGINTLVGYESQGGTVSMAQWTNAAVANGMYMIRQGSSNLAADANQQNLLAWMQNDEPEVNGSTAAANQALYAQYKAADPNMPVFENFSGGYVLGWQGNWTQSTYAPYIAASDWDSNDIYPVTGWGQPTRLNAPAQAVTQLSNWSSGKPQFAIIEASDQNLSWVPQGSVASAAQVRAETWDAVIHGAAGIIYFPQQIGGGFSYNNMSPAVASMIQTQSAHLQSLAGVLEQGTVDTSVTMGLPGGFEGVVKSYQGHDYLMVLNLNTTTQNASIHLNGTGSTQATVVNEGRSVSVNSGTISDSFAANDVHVYELA